jgi:hypothetical protein
MRIDNAATRSQDPAKTECAKCGESGDKRTDKAFVTVMDDVRSQLRSPSPEPLAHKVPTDGLPKKGTVAASALPGTPLGQTRRAGEEISAGSSGRQAKKRPAASDCASPIVALPAAPVPKRDGLIPQFPGGAGKTEPSGEDGSPLNEQPSQDAAPVMGQEVRVLIPEFMADLRSRTGCHGNKCRNRQR